MARAETHLHVPVTLNDQHGFVLWFVGRPARTCSWSGPCAN